MRRFRFFVTIFFVLALFAGCDAGSDLFTQKDLDKMYVLDVSQDDKALSRGVPLDNKAPVDLSINVMSGAPSPSFVTVLLLDSKNKEVARISFAKKTSDQIIPEKYRIVDSFEEALPPLVFPENLPFGYYVLSTQILDQYESVLSVIDTPLLIYDLPRPQMSISLYPAQLNAGKSALFKVVLTGPVSKDSWISWKVDGIVYSEGFIDNKSDRILWTAPKQKGIHSISADFYPFKPLADEAVLPLSSSEIKVPILIPAVFPSEVPVNDPFVSFKFNEGTENTGTQELSRLSVSKDKPYPEEYSNGFGFVLGDGIGIVSQNAMIPWNASQPQDFSILFSLTSLAENSTLDDTESAVIEKKVTVAVSSDIAKNPIKPEALTAAQDLQPTADTIVVAGLETTGDSTSNTTPVLELDTDFARSLAVGDTKNPKQSSSASLETSEETFEEAPVAEEPGIVLFRSYDSSNKVILELGISGRVPYVKTDSRLSSEEALPNQLSTLFYNFNATAEGVLEVSIYIDGKLSGMGKLPDTRKGASAGISEIAGKSGYKAIYNEFSVYGHILSPFVETMKGMYSDTLIHAISFEEPGYGVPVYAVSGKQALSESKTATKGLVLATKEQGVSVDIPPALPRFKLELKTRAGVPSVSVLLDNKQSFTIDKDGVVRYLDKVVGRLETWQTSSAWPLLVEKKNDSIVISDNLKQNVVTILKMNASFAGLSISPGSAVPLEIQSLLILGLNK